MKSRDGFYVGAYFLFVLLTWLVTLGMSFHLVEPHCPPLKQEKSGKILAQKSEAVIAGLSGNYQNLFVSVMHFVQAHPLCFEVISGAFLFLIARSVVRHNGLDYPRCGLCCRAGSASRAVELYLLSH